MLTEGRAKLGSEDGFSVGLDVPFDMLDRLGQLFANKNQCLGRFSHRRVSFRYASCAVLMSLNPLEPMPASDRRSFFWRAIRLRIAGVCTEDCRFGLRRDDWLFLEAGLAMVSMIAQHLWLDNRRAGGL